MYNQEYLNIIEKRNEFEVFTYKDSLRFNILFNDSPSSEIVDRFIIEIKHYMNEIKKGTILLWYSQVNGFSNELIDKLENHDEPYHFYKFQIEKDNINPNVDLKGLEKRSFTSDIIDTCIDILEDVFTPFPDEPGSFRSGREHIIIELENAELFYKDDELVGFNSHTDGHITNIVIRKEFQGQGYGEVIVRSLLKAIGNDAYLMVGHHNTRAIALYKKVGFQKVYESKKVELYG